MMEQNDSNSSMPSTSLCVKGCGFYGNQAFDGMCSKCHKDQLKRRQHNPAPSILNTSTSLSSDNKESITVTYSSSHPIASLSTTSSTVAVQTDTTPSRVGIVLSTTPSVETASPTVPSVAAAVKGRTEDAESLVNTSSASAAADTSGSESPAESDKKPKKSRCHTCKKKVGLTGFQCRCGGQYCGLHRYSDKHECTFDYKELAQEEIRKANPVIVGSKVQKI